ncbi:MAG TPA: alpha/beta hydrolase [Actinomycetales bacterium]|jgi:pimeloyl-ACP methyl ester carboxylesterase
MVTALDVRTDDGRVLRVHDSGRPSPRTVLWHHGTPQTGALLEPLLTACVSRGIRLVSYGRPSYGGSTPLPGRDVASAATDVAQIADALGLGRFWTMGASGGGPHALACAALLADRVAGVVCLAGIAPYTGEAGWFDGMASPAGLHAALRGRAAKEAHEADAEFDPTIFVAADWAALDGDWASLGEDAGAAGSAGPGGIVDDDLAYVAPWGLDLTSVTAPVLLVQGGLDRVIPPAHAHDLLGGLPLAELWLRPRDGHVSVLRAVPVALDWLLTHP